MNVSILPIDQLSDEHISRWRHLQAENPELAHPVLTPEFSQTVGNVRTGVEVAIVDLGNDSFAYFPFQRAADNTAEFPGGVLAGLQAVIAPPTADIDPLRLMRAAGLRAWHFDHLLATQATFSHHHRHIDDSAIVDLTGGFEAYCAQLHARKSRFIKNMERKRRKLVREVGPVHFEWHVGEHDLIDQLISYKRHQLKVQNHVDIYTVDWVCDFLHELLKFQNANFRATLSVLSVSDKPVAIHLGMCGGQTMSSFIPTHDMELARYSPGAILHYELFRTAIDRGITRLDLGRGMNQLKASAMTKTIPVAIGSVDLRPIRRLATDAWYRARALAHASKITAAPLRWYRNVRSRFGPGSVIQNP